METGPARKTDLVGKGQKQWRNGNPWVKGSVRRSPEQERKGSDPIMGRNLSVGTKKRVFWKQCGVPLKDNWVEKDVVYHSRILPLGLGQRGPEGHVPVRVPQVVYLLRITR